MAVLNDYANVLGDLSFPKAFKELFNIRDRKELWELLTRPRYIGDYSKKSGVISRFGLSILVHENLSSKIEYSKMKVVGLSNSYWGLGIITSENRMIDKDDFRFELAYLPPFNTSIRYFKGRFSDDKWEGTMTESQKEYPCVIYDKF